MSCSPPGAGTAPSSGVVASLLLLLLLLLSGCCASLLLARDAAASSPSCLLPSASPALVTFAAAVAAVSWPVPLLLLLLLLLLLYCSLLVAAAGVVPGAPVALNSRAMGFSYSQAAQSVTQHTQCQLPGVIGERSARCRRAERKAHSSLRALVVQQVWQRISLASTS